MSGHWGVARALRIAFRVKHSAQIKPAGRGLLAPKGQLEQPRLRDSRLSRVPAELYARSALIDDEHFARATAEGLDDKALA